MAIFRSNRRKRERLRQKANPKDGSNPSTQLNGKINPTLAVIIKKLILYGTVFIVLHIYGKLKKEEDARTDADKKESSFKIEENYYSVKEFLDYDTALEFRNELLNEWHKMEKLPNENVGNAWLFATNNDGLKEKSLVNIEERNATAHNMRQEGLFSYSNWELDPLHPLVIKMGQTLIGRKVKAHLKKILPSDSGASLSLDFSVMHYSVGNFLSLQNITIQDSWTLVLSLSEDLKMQDVGFEEGAKQVTDTHGEIRFSCPDSNKSEQNGDPDNLTNWCKPVRPEFNEAFIFPSTSKGPEFEILPVPWKAKNDSPKQFFLAAMLMEKLDERVDSKANTEL